MKIFYTTQHQQFPLTPGARVHLKKAHRKKSNRNCQSDGLGHRNNFSPKWITILRKLTKTAEFISWAALERTAPNPPNRPDQPASCVWQRPVPGASGRGARNTGWQEPSCFLWAGISQADSCFSSLVRHLSLQNFSNHRLYLVGDPSDQYRLKGWQGWDNLRSKATVGILQGLYPWPVKKGYQTKHSSFCP